VLARCSQLEHLSVSLHSFAARTVTGHITAAVLPHLRSLEIKILSDNSSRLLPPALSHTQLSVLEAGLASFSALERLILHVLPSFPTGWKSRLQSAAPSGCELFMETFACVLPEEEEDDPDSDAE
jgi:hypothetical protein